ncbi:MAG TPA: hypothetical protein VNI78_10620, partial [Vicinamibacterales bacterium]|nr:hypothetical protein [Vicinamibacterales bacterium]
MPASDASIVVRATSSFSMRAHIVAAVVLAVSFHLLTTVNLLGTVIRLGASDFLLPALLLWAGWSWWRGRSPSPASGLAWLWVWIAILTGCVGLSLIVGRVHMGGWSSWALVNRSLGWLCLVGYMALGIWTAAAGTETVRAFLRAFVVAAWLGAFVSLLVFLSFHLGFVSDISGGYYRLRGAFENPNAFGFALVVAVLVQLAHSGPHRLFGHKLDILGLALAVLGIFFCGSRSAWIGIAAGFAGLLTLRAVDLRDIVLALAVAVAVERAVFFG